MKKQNTKPTKREPMETFSISLRRSQRHAMAEAARQMAIDSLSQVYRMAIEEFLSRRNRVA